MEEQRRHRIRVLIAKVGLDGHQRGAWLVCTALKDAGMEVMYTGVHQTPEQVVNTAVQEDVDIVGISSLADSHNVLVPKVIELLKTNKAEDKLVILGGFIQAEDIASLKEGGVAEVFPIGSSLESIISFVRENVRK